jgi:hypothetical protein
MTTKKYYDTSFLSDIQNLELISGYNFKKINNKTTKSFIFICSFIINEKNEIDHQQDLKFNFDFLDYQINNYFDLNFNDDNSYESPKKVENCKFKIIFKKYNNYYKLNNKSNFLHCHACKNILNKNNEITYRNIKFTYNFVFNYLNLLCEITFNNNINLNEVKKKLKNIKNNYIKMYLNFPNKKKININKKINQFIRAIIKVYEKSLNYYKIKNSKNYNKKELLKIYIELFLKQNANSYLRFEDIEKLNELIKF